jgi:hypothetical protein
MKPVRMLLAIIGIVRESTADQIGLIGVQRRAAQNLVGAKQPAD